MRPARVACWLLGSDARAVRVSQVLLAWRGDPGCLAPGDTTAPTAANAPLALAAAPVVVQHAKLPRPHMGGYEVTPTLTG